MQANLAAAMAAQTLLFSATAPPASLFQSPSSARPFHSLRLAAGPGGAAAARALVVADATKKAVAVLKGTSQVEGVVTLTQDDQGHYPPALLLSLVILLPSSTTTN
jgi:Cu-Zn family superoxide dismutase